tara:strand:+ start:50753 stop:52246 length:1494 start_codon:yes stop_codon:yes gene_type:complete
MLKDFVYKFSGNILSGLATLCIEFLVPKGLGPELYGIVSYLREIFTQFFAFLDFGFSNAVSVYSAQRPSDKGLFYSFLLIPLTFFVITGILLCMSELTPLGEALFMEIPFRWILLSSLFAFLVWLSQSASKMLDAYHLTVKLEITRTLVRSLSVIILIALYLIHHEHWSIELVYYYFIGTWALLSASYLTHIFIYWRNLQKDTICTQPKSHYIRELRGYTSPLFLYTLVVCAGLIFDRWFLQKNYGAIEQSKFALAMVFNNACLLFIAAATPLLTREFSKASKSNLEEGTKQLLSVALIPLFSIVSAACVFISFEAGSIVYFFMGAQFQASIPVVSLAVYYSPLQVLGQVLAALFYARSKTKVIMAAGIISTVIGVFMSVLLIGTEQSTWTLNLGAKGLAWKFIITNLISIGVCAAYAYQALGITVIKTLLTCLISISYYYAIMHFLNYSLNPLSLSLESIFCLKIALYLIGGLLQGAVLWKVLIKNLSFLHKGITR